MQKVPTLFVRNPEDRRHVLNEVTPGCEWVLAGEGRATRKYDGTCVRLDAAGAWWARREVKPGKSAPAGYQVVQRDEVTGKAVGWEPMAQSGFAAFHAEALDAAEDCEDPWSPWPVGTYELIGPKINGNPERYDTHWLIAHEHASPLAVLPLTFEGIRESLQTWHRLDRIEGVVWHHPDGRTAKLKARDFPS